MFELLKLELRENKSHYDDQSIQELVNMLQVPYHLERFMIFGLLVCFNSFLTIFTVVPLKIGIACYKVVALKIKSVGKNEVADPWDRTDSDDNKDDNKHWLHPQRYPYLLPEEKLPKESQPDDEKVFSEEILRNFYTIILIGLSVTLLLSLRLDILRMYHDVRGSTQIKLYVMFGVLAVADKLCLTLGQDLLNIFHRVSSQRRLLPLVVFFLLLWFYLSCHGYILIYQTVSLNVAANSYSNALLSLLLSNQFSELKGSVFKKFEREGLFQMTMADLTERFQLTLMLGIIATRNLIELHSNQLSHIPNSWKSWNTWIGAILGPGIVVIGSEIFVDWLKHCYIIKFNKFKPKVYGNFLHVLSLDFLEVFNEDQLVDYVALTKRIGLPLLANIVCFLRMTMGDFSNVFAVRSPIGSLVNVLIIGCVFSVLLFIRLLLGLTILKMARSIKKSHRVVQPYIHAHQPTARTFPFTPGSSPLISSQDLPLDIKPLDLHPPPVIGKSRRASLDSIDQELRAQKSRSRIDIGDIFLPGIPNSEASSINPSTRAFLYDDEKVPPTVEEKRNGQVLKKEKNALEGVMRYEMSSKRIW